MLAILLLIMPACSAEQACLLMKVSNFFYYCISSGSTICSHGCFLFKCCNIELVPPWYAKPTVQMLHVTAFSCLLKNFHTYNFYFFLSTSLMLWSLVSQCSPASSSPWSMLVTTVELSAIFNKKIIISGIVRPRPTRACALPSTFWALLGKGITN